MEMTVRDLLEVLMDGIGIKIVMVKIDSVDEQLSIKETLLYEGLKPFMEDGVPCEDEEIDEKILDMEVMLAVNEYDNDTSRIATVIEVFPLRKR